MYSISSGFIKVGILGLLSLSASAVIAGGAQMSIGSDTVAPGATSVLTLDYETDGTQTSVTADLFYDDAVLTPQTSGPNNDVDGCLDSLPGAIGGLFTSCRNPNPGQIRIILTAADAVTPMPAAPAFGTISFDVDGGATPGAVSNLDLVSFDTTPGTAADLSVVDGTVTIEAPAGQGFYASSPAPGGTITFPPAIVGDAAVPDQVVNVSNASPDTAFDVTGVNTAFPLNNVDVFPITLAAGGNADVTFSCTPNARGVQNGTFEITHDSAGGPTSPVEYNYECTGLSPNVQVPAGPIALSALTVDPSAPTANINVTNPQDGFTSDANNVTATAGAGDTEITVTTAGPTNIAPDGNFDFVVECDNTNAGTFSRTIDITWDEPGVGPRGGGSGSASITVDCDITDEVASYDSTPAPGATIDLGTTTNGVTTAAVSIDVENDGVGTTTASDLTITGATTSDPQFAVTFDGSAISVGDTLADAIEVTCTPDPGTDGLITATLSVTHDGDANPSSPVDYDLECVGEPDGAFSSTPAPDGTLNLGVVPPNSSTPPGSIDFFNNGAADDIEVSCTFSGPAEIVFLSDPFDETIAAGASASAEFQCTPTTPEIFQGTLTCDVIGDQNFVDPIEYTVECRGQPLVVPTMNQWGLIIMSLMLLMVGGLVGRRWFAAQA